MLLAACWSSAPIAEPMTPTQLMKHRGPRPKPGCWTRDFTEMRPPFPADALSACWQLPPVEASPCLERVWRDEYTRLAYWTDRWFDACDPAR